MQGKRKKMKLQYVFFWASISAWILPNLASAQATQGLDALRIISEGRVLSSHFSDQMVAWLYVIVWGDSFWQCSLFIGQAAWRATCLNGMG